MQRRLEAVRDLLLSEFGMMLVQPSCLRPSIGTAARGCAGFLCGLSASLSAGRFRSEAVQVLVE